ncbi:MAG: hypothetical protein UY13_C0002G0467 [Candidatus Pacebacteria bacterium GW2011_GWB1_47_8]|nr:MAG: hypothetical protein UX28_C0002G0026 [Candidatus Pacebacteria bacterium GW2011_GWA1_46_10]KKU84555.1 MAG: hypothetical protein UY13_C0002G0467 [Candidatus Pacebacteria bacterium GW2011_GWB1_47_8]HCR81663.1 hypothetical protein [Candidatus Paceibacterota bacterium]
MVKILSHQEFLKTFINVPRVSVNLLIEDKQGKLLLTQRAITPGVGKWHYPGGFLLKGETIEACLKRLAKREFNYDLKEAPEFVGVFENLAGDPRGHVIDLMYRLKLNHQIPLNATTETKAAQYFDRIPKEIGFNHHETLLKLGYKVEE